MSLPSAHTHAKTRPSRNYRGHSKCRLESECTCGSWRCHSFRTLASSPFTSHTFPFVSTTCHPLTYRYALVFSFMSSRWLPLRRFIQVSPSVTCQHPRPCPPLCPCPQHILYPHHLLSYSIFPAPVLVPAPLPQPNPLSCLPSSPSPRSRPCPHAHPDTLPPSHARFPNEGQVEVKSTGRVFFFHFLFPAHHIKFCLAPFLTVKSFPTLPAGGSGPLEAGNCSARRAVRDASEEVMHKR